MKKVNLGIIGVGRWGVRYLDTAERIWPDDSVQFKYGAGNSPGWTTSRTDNIPENFFEYWEDLICRPDIDGVVIATPATTHYQIAAVALARKLPVLIEKPAALSSRETYGLLRLATQMKTVALVGHQHLHSPAFETMRKLLMGNTIRKIECVAGGPGPIRDSCNALWDWAPHDLAMIFTLVPLENEDLIKKLLTHVVKRASVVNGPGGGQTWQFSLALSHQGHPVDVEVKISNQAQDKERRLVVTTTDNLALTYDDRAEQKLTVNGENIPVSGELALDRQLRGFVRAIENGPAHQADLTLALRIAETIESIEESV